MIRTRVAGITLLVGLLIACAAPGGGGRPAAGASPRSAQPAGDERTAAAAAPPGGAATPAARDAMRYGLNTTTVNAAPLWVAKDEGLFARRGIDVELVTMPADLLVASLISGELAMGSLATTPLLNGALGGADLAFLGSFENLLRFWLY